MDYDLLLSNIRGFVPISDDDWQLIMAHANERHFKRGEFINKEGEVNRFTNFIVSGSARVFYIGSSGYEHVVMLGIRAWWVSDFASFITQQKGLLYTEALESTGVISFSYENFQLLYEKIPLFERFYRLLIQKAYASFQYRMIHTLSMDAEQRYVLFSEKYPEMVHQIPQKYIASYLGMTPEFLSMVKRRIYEKKKKKDDPSAKLY